MEKIWKWLLDWIKEEAQSGFKWLIRFIIAAIVGWVVLAVSKIRPELGAPIILGLAAFTIVFLLLFITRKGGLKIPNASEIADEVRKHTGPVPTITTSQPEVSLEYRIRDWLYEAGLTLQKKTEAAYNFYILCTLDNGRLIIVVHTRIQTQSIHLATGIKLEGEHAIMWQELPQTSRQAVLNAAIREVAKSDYRLSINTDGAFAKIEKPLDISSLTSRLLDTELATISNMMNAIHIGVVSELNREHRANVSAQKTDSQ